jgi:hypothetical protein
MSADGGRATMPTVLAELKRRDGDKIARGVFQQLDLLGPVHVPPPFAISDPEIVKQWRAGGTLKDEHVEEFARWLTHTTNRSAAIGENERRLNTTTWAQDRLRADSDYFEHFSQFHLERWGVEQWSDDARERADQVKACARRGMPSVRPMRKGGM